MREKMKQIKKYDEFYMKPAIFCEKTGFKGRNDIVLYYDMLNKITDYSEINKAIKENGLTGMAIQRGFDACWDESKKKEFFDNVNIRGITDFHASDVDYEQVIRLCPNLRGIGLDLKANQIVDVSQSTKLEYLAIAGFNGFNVKGIKNGLSIHFWGKQGSVFAFPDSLPRRLRSIGFTYYKTIDLNSLNLEYLEGFNSSYGGKSIIASADNAFVPYIKSIDIAHGDCSFLTPSFISKAKLLKVLMIENCTPIISLKGISSLEHVSITDTDILDKDLTPLKSSKYVNVTDKKGFNIKNKDLPKHNR